MEQPGSRKWQLSVTLELSEDQRNIEVRIDSNVAGLRHLNLPTDMIYDRLMEPVGNDLRRLCHNLQQYIQTNKRR